MKVIVSCLFALTICNTMVAQNVGIGVPIPAQKLDIAGNLKISGAIMPGGNAGTAGQILISNGAGNTPVWEGPVAFMAYQAMDANVSSNAYGALSALTEVFDEGNDFNNSVFTAPVNGIYHFEASVKWGTNNSSSNYSQTSIEKCDNAGSPCTKLASSKMNNQTSAQHFLSATVKLVAGDKIKVFVVHTNSEGNSRTLEGKDPDSAAFTSGNISTYFSGHLVR
ncbi:MAG: hypothetical protein V4722_26250 [Bacteroidota bacterium]